MVFYRLFLDDSLDRFDKFTLGAMYFIRIFLIFAILFALSQQKWFLFFVTFLIWALSFLPNFLEWQFKIDIPLEFELAIVVFIYATLFLGEVQGYYTEFLLWDSALHAGASLALGIVGFLVMLVLYQTDKLKAKPITLVIFSFSFALAVGAMWEIFEFGMDQLFGFNMQKSGLLDTMWDLIVDAAGAFVASLFGFIYLKRGKTFFVFDRVVKKFIKNNPGLFGKV